MNSTNSFADKMKMAVTYAGMNRVGQQLFRNGSPLVTDTYATMEKAVERFGKRIETGGEAMRFSTQYDQGLIAATKGEPYTPPKKLGVQAELEYGMGYIAGLQEKLT